MNEFNIGDRVVVNVGYDWFFRTGNVGTIVKVYKDIGGCIVEFDPGQPGVDYRYGVTSVGSWCVSLQHIEHIPESQENTPWYETEEGKEWLSKQCSVEEQFELEKQKMVHKIGDRYVNGDEEYILAQPTNHKVCLIDLTSGNRWDDPVKVVDLFAITEDEWNQICGGDEFVLVE